MHVRLKIYKSLKSILPRFSKESRTIYIALRYEDIKLNEIPLSKFHLTVV